MRRHAVAAVAGVIGVVAAVGTPASSVARKPARHAYSETLVGKTIITSCANTSTACSRGTSFTNMYKVASSVNGNGAAVQVGKLTGHLAPLAGSSVTTTYFADGVSTTKETFLLLPTHTGTIFTINGHGKCAGGTRAHKRERCTYAFKGTLDTKTTLIKIEVTGSTTL